MSTSEPDALFEPDAAVPPATEPPPKQRSTADTKYLLAQLERHYIKPGENQPGGIFVPEVSVNGGWGAGRRVDAIYVGFTAASGRMMIGHELKVSRSDWLHELDQLTKADAWAEQCHEWWIVALPGIVKREELPAEWGLMEPPSRARGRKMRIVKPAQRFADRQPSWDACRSVYARWDTLRANAILDARRTAEEQAREQINAARQRIADNTPEREAQELLTQIREALGDKYMRIVPVDSGHRLDVSVDELARLGTLLQSHQAVRKHVARINGGYRKPLDEARSIIDDLQGALDTLDSVARAIPADADPVNPDAGS